MKLSKTQTRALALLVASRWNIPNQNTLAALKRRGLVKVGINRHWDLQAKSGLNGCGAYVEDYNVFVTPLGQETVFLKFGTIDREELLKLLSDLPN